MMRKMRQDWSPFKSSMILEELALLAPERFLIQVMVFLYFDEV
jgi:hypothetical protein